VPPTATTAPTATPPPPTPTAPPTRASTPAPAVAPPTPTTDSGAALARLRALLRALDRLPPAKGRRDDDDRPRQELLKRLEQAEEKLRDGKAREAREHLRDLTDRLDEAVARGTLDPRLAARIREEVALLLGRP
jgi:hypothetical protein